MAGRTPEEILEDAKKVIGAESKPVYGRYPVEYDPIRRYAHMCEQRDPLFLDPEYAAKTRYGGVIAQPLLIGNFAGGGAWPLPEGHSTGNPMANPRPKERDETAAPEVPTAGNRAINLTTEYEFFLPVKIGDRLSSTSRIADVYIKGIKIDPKAFWTVTERIVRNQNGEVVLVARNIGLRHRSPEEVAAAGDA